MRNIIDVVFVTTVTLAASPRVFADPTPTDSKLSEECRAAMDQAASSAMSLAAFENLERTEAARVESLGKGVLQI
jgi:hypothetical protein